VQWIFRFALGLVITSSIVGCNSAGEQLAWIHNHGGAENQGGARGDARIAKVRSACALLGKIPIKMPQVQVLSSSVACAYSWPNGNIFVTHGLVDLLDDRELAAAISHEMGHLLNDGHLHGVVSLRGCCVSPDIEARADATGVRLLETCGVDRSAMISMLRKVESSAEVPPSCQKRIEWRICLLAQLAGVKP
jgi:predicted Zn-dependent protease